MSDTIPSDTNQGKIFPATTFIYRLRDPETKLIRYVGKANDPQSRLAQHIRDRSKYKSQKNSWIISLHRKGLFPILEIIEEILYDLWEERERYWIKMYRDEGFPLTNGTDGGDGNRGLSADARARISSAHKGKKLSPETRRKMGESRKGVKRPASVAEKLRIANYGRKLSSEHVAAISASHKGKAPSLQARIAHSAKFKGKPVPPEILEKKRATMETRRLAGAYDKPRKPLSEESLAKRNEAIRLSHRQKREANSRPYNETEISYAIFREYCEMGKKRSLAKLSIKRKLEGETIGISTASLKKFSSQYHWRERVIEYDRNLEKLS